MVAPNVKHYGPNRAAISVTTITVLPVVPTRYSMLPRSRSPTRVGRLGFWTAALTLQKQQNVMAVTDDLRPVPADCDRSQEGERL